MGLTDITDREPIRPFEAGGKLPWHDPAFSERMLREHLSQEHDAASRRSDRIDRHVAWIHDDVLDERPTRILDLGCGPGLYCSRLARLGHTCTGLDIGPASIAHARATAESEGLACTFRTADLKDGNYGSGFGLALFLFGEFNAFPRDHALAILRAAREALAPGGTLVLEPETSTSVVARGRAPSTWFTAQAGLFSDRPHVCLQENAHFDAERVTVERFLITDAASGEVTPCAVSTTAWEEEEIAQALEESGFRDVRRYASLGGADAEGRDSLFVLTARSGSAGVGGR